MSAPFEAEYRSECVLCEEPIVPGTLAKYVAWNEIAHAVPCEKKPAADLCRDCFMEKAVTGTCGCD